MNSLENNCKQDCAQLSATVVMRALAGNTPPSKGTALICCILGWGAGKSIGEAVLIATGEVLNPIGEVLKATGEVLNPIGDVLVPIGDILDVPTGDVLVPMGDVLNNCCTAGGVVGSDEIGGVCRAGLIARGWRSYRRLPLFKPSFAVEAVAEADTWTAVGEASCYGHCWYNGNVCLV